MRQAKSVILILVAALPAVSLWAKPIVTNSVGAYLSGAYYTQFLPNASDINRPNGCETGLGFDYRLTCNHFLMNMGVGASYRYFVFRMSSSQILMPNSLDSDDFLFTYVYELGQRTDAYSRLGVEVPLMLGGDFRRVYFLVGAKLNVACYGHVKSTVPISSYGDYPQLLDPIRNMPEHQFFPEREKQEEQTISLSSELAAAAEVGVLLTPAGARYAQGARPEIRLAAFANYGLLAFGKNSYANLPLIETPGQFSDVKDMFTPIRLNHVLATQSLGGKVIPLSVGLKIIVSVPFRKQSAYPCRCVTD